VIPYRWGRQQPRVHILPNPVDQSHPVAAYLCVMCGRVIGHGGRIGLLVVEPDPDDDRWVAADSLPGHSTCLEPLTPGGAAQLARYLRGDLPVCADEGPPTGPGTLGYRCTEPPEHLGLHQAEGENGEVYDTWPRSEEPRHP
jgi:hypothetical protein